MKSKGVAYLLLIFTGVIGGHKFYVGKIGMGIVYLLTAGLLGVGCFIDLFTLGNQVDMVNAIRSGRNVNQTQNVVVNVTVPKDSSE